jgi:hypothetical protein
VDQQLDGEKRQVRTEHSSEKPDHAGLHGCHGEHLPRACAPGSQQSQFAPVAIDGAQGRQIGEAERQQRPGHGEHDEQRLRVERIAGGGFEPFGEVVDELDLARQAAFDRVADLAGVLEGAARRPGEAGAVELGLHLPLHAGDGPRHRRRTGAHGVDARQRAADLAGEGVHREDRDVGRGLRRRRADQGIQRLEEDIGHGDECHPSDLEPASLTATEAEPHRVSDPGSQRRRQLLVEDDLARPKAAAQEAEGVDVSQVVVGDGENRPRAGVGNAGRAEVADPGQGCSCDRRCLGDIGLAADGACQRPRLRIARNRALEIERDATGRGGGHRP